MIYGSDQDFKVKILSRQDILARYHHEMTRPYVTQEQNIFDGTGVLFPSLSSDIKWTDLSQL